MKKQVRIEEILKTIQRENGASVKELSNRLDVTEMTIRRDIKSMCDDGIVKLISGAVVLNTTVTNTEGFYNYDFQNAQHSNEKQAIGKLAASLITSGDIVYFDNGTTASGIVSYVDTSAHITAVCCSMNALLAVHEKGIKDIIFIGGRYLPDLQIFESAESAEYLKKTRITKAFISAAGVNDTLGVTCVNPVEVSLKLAAMKNAVEKILVVDSTKFEQVKPAFFANLTDFQAVITDSGITDEWKQMIERLGIRLYIAKS